MLLLPAGTALLLALAVPSARAAEVMGSEAFYVGDLHAHTGYSGDGGSTDLGNCEGTCGALADVFDTARANGLDFLAITDHLNSTYALASADWDDLLARVLAAHDPAGGFVTIPGGELWFVDPSARLGHKTLLLFGDDDDVAPLLLDDVRMDATSAVASCDDIWTWMSNLDAQAGPAVLVPHHPAVRSPMPTDWSCHDPTWEPTVEIYSKHGNSLDASGYDTPGAGLYTSSTVTSAMDPDGLALAFGFVGGTDSHDTRPGEVCATDTEHTTHLYGGGLTIAVLDADETFDRMAIHDAIRARRTYVTTGPVLPLGQTWSAAGLRLGGLGEALSVPASLPLDAEVRLPADREADVLSIELVGPDARWALSSDGAGAWSGTVPADDVPAWLYVAVQVDGEGWYDREGGCADGGDAYEWLWTSPSFLTRYEDDADGDGASAWVDDCDDDDATIHPGADDAPYDGLDADCAGDDDFDADGDGAPAEPWGSDCDDQDPAVFPGAAETWYDDLDADCAGDDDFDQDHDGWPGGAAGLPDCDDTDPARSPDATERWYDGIDQDCDGGSDFDQDGDGIESAAFGSGDCDDSDPTVAPAAPERWYDGIDQDCNPATEYDADGDGVRFPADCADDDPRRSACATTARTAVGCAHATTHGGVLLAGLALAATLGRRFRRA